MANSANWRPTAGVSHGEQVHQMLVIEGPIHFFDPSINEYVELELVNNGDNTYSFRITSQDSVNSLPNYEE